MKKLLPFVFIFLAVAIFFWQFLLKGLIPVPADTIVGLYHPFRDFYAKDYPRGIPFKNFMITDPVRQQYPWKNLVIKLEKNKELPLWNPYTFAGGPLLANFQSGAFYPLNLLFFLFSFPQAFGLYILLQPLLGAIFLFLYLNNLKLKKQASVLGALSFAFGGFSISWLEWGNVIHTALWLPLILLSIDKILLNKQSFKLLILKLKLNPWLFVLLFSLLASFSAGHLQIFFYSFIVSFLYLALRIYQLKSKRIIILKFIAIFLSFVLLSFPLWINTLKFIFLSARSIDQNYRTIEGWFLPWQNLIQFVIPDFFGNPSTLNYFGIWNYGEFVSYIGIASFIFALFSLLRKDKKTLFFFSCFLLSLVFALPTIIAKVPYKFEFPFLSTSQPTRLIFIADFSLSVLAALGFDYFLKTNKKRSIFYALAFLWLLFILVIVVTFVFNFFPLKDLSVTKQNLILPAILLFSNSVLIILAVIIKNKKLITIFSLLIVLLLFADLLRFGLKYTPFSQSKYLYPKTKTIDFLEKNLGNYRYMATDSRILPPNFSSIYKLQSLDGYDPLYLESYGEFMAAFGRDAPNIDKPFGFNRIITPQNRYTSLVNLLGVKYILTFEDIKDDRRYKKVFFEGQINIYENLEVLPRAFFVNNVYLAKDNQDTINQIFKFKNDLRTNAVVKGFGDKKTYSSGNAEITNYAENRVEIETQNTKEGFLVLTDSYYPNWHVTIDGREGKILKTDYNFRGVVVPAGNHKVKFYITLF